MINYNLHFAALTYAFHIFVANFTFLIRYTLFKIYLFLYTLFLRLELLLFCFGIVFLFIIFG